MYWGDKRYHSLNWHLRQAFGEKVMKISLNAGFGCPNRDGTIAAGGCIYCCDQGSGACAGNPLDDLGQQFAEVKTRMQKKWPQGKYIAYFQAFSNTYAPVKVLRELYERALQEQGVVGLAISTRPDCLPDQVVDLLAELNQKTYLWVELGLQSSHDRTLKLINRGHDYASFVEGATKLADKGISICTHLILGLPGETREDMLETGVRVAGLPISGIKLHSLHLLKNTPMVKLYEQGNLKFLDRETYAQYAVDMLELFPPHFVIHRLTGDAPRRILMEPQWILQKWEALRAIDRALEERDTWQGKLWQGKEGLR